MFVFEKFEIDLGDNFNVKNQYHTEDRNNSSTTFVMREKIN